MNNKHLEVVPEQTPRLVFDSEKNDIPDTHVPQFLLQGKKKTSPSVELSDKAPIQEPEDKTPISEVTSGAAVVEDTDTPNVDTQAAGPIDIDKLTVEELQRHQEEIDQKIREKQEAQKQAVIQQIVDVVNTFHIPVDELVDALGGLHIKRKGTKAIQKYQDPETGATWSGRGKEPNWIRGKDREQFLVD